MEKLNIRIKGNGNMKAQDLKNSILQLAIQGKLVPQDVNDESAEVLYAKIQAEKQKLIKEGKIKKDKPLPPITDGEIPFTIPSTWKWVRLGELVTVLGGKRIPAGRKLTTQNTGHIYIRVSDMKNETVLNHGLLYVPEDIYSSISNYIIKKEDVYITVAGTIGKVGKIPTELDGANLTENADRLVFSWLSQDWLIIFLKSHEIQNQISNVTTVVGQPKLAIKSIEKLLIPLPPLAEQKRIVAKIEEFEPLVKQYDKAETELSALNDSFPEQLKKSILQYAIQGKLVAQDVNDEPAEVLYAKIQAEKQKLIKEGKIKKDKPLPPITDDEIPFAIPSTWKWVRLGNIGDWGAGATPNRSNSKYYDGNIPWLKTGDLNDGLITNIPETISELAVKETSAKLKPIGSVLMAMYGATIGKLGILGVEATTNQACCACIPMSGVYNKYLFYYLLSQRKNFIQQGAGGAQPNISREKIIPTLFPLPPLAEQHRIVAKVTELMQYCEKLQEWHNKVGKRDV